MFRRSLLAGAAALIVPGRAWADAFSNPPPFLMGGPGRGVLNSPINGIAVTDAPYNAIDDGLNGYFTATWTQNATGLSLYTDNAQAITVQNTGPNGTAEVRFPNTVAGVGASPSPSWVGDPIAINGAGTAAGTLVAKVVQTHYDKNDSSILVLTLDRAAPTPLTASVQQVACPCFLNGTEGTGLNSCVGQAIWIALGGGLSGGTGGSPGSPLYAQPLVSTIVGYTSPFQVTLNDNITGRTVTNQPAVLIEWGTDNSTAVLNAGLAALARGSEALFFPGMNRPASTGRFWVGNFLAYGGAFNAAQVITSSVLAGLNWFTSDATVFLPSGIADATNVGFWDQRDYKRAIPWQAASAPPAKRTIDARVHLPRCQQASYIVVELLGDSWSGKDPTGEDNAVWGPFATNLQRQNPGKKIYFVSQGATGLTWHALAAAISGYSTVSVAGLGTVTPDLVCLFVTSGNDAGNLHRNDIMRCINTVKGWATRNGLPPDILMLTGAYPRTEEDFSAQTTQVYEGWEFPGVLNRGIARTQGIGYVDLAERGAWALRGWSEDNPTLKFVPTSGFAAGVAGATNPYVIPVQCRNFFLALALGTGAGTGTSFWASNNRVEIALSPKPDNRLVIGTESGTGNLIVTAVTWGLTVSTPVTTTSGAATLATSGHTSVTAPTNTLPTAPSYKLAGVGSYAGMIGQCFWAQGVYYGDSDFRSYIYGLQTNTIPALMDGNGTNGTAASHFVGGQQFVASDATAQADLIVGGAGAVTHPLTGANSLVTKVSAFTSRTSITMAANAAATLAASSQSVFLGAISVPPSYHVPQVIGTDAGAQPVLTVRVIGTHVKVGYVMGGFTPTTNPRAVIQTNHILIWEGEVERWGGPFFIKIFTSQGQQVQPVLMMVDDPDADVRMPAMTQRHAFGTGGTGNNYWLGGDIGHPSQAFLNLIVDEATATQVLATDINFDHTTGTNTPTTGFSYTIPSDQVFTEFTPAGTLASGTVVLPAVFPQGGRLEIMSTQTITALTVSAPTGFTIAGTAVTTIAANATIAYRLNGTVFVRVL